MAIADQTLLDYIGAHSGVSREDIRKQVAPTASQATVWRALKRLAHEGKVEASGKGRATRYRLAGAAAVRLHLQTPYNRRRPVGYKREFIDRYVPDKTPYLSETDRQRLREAGGFAPALPLETYSRRILERLLIDLSWASSRLEGNTYDILETERLIRFGEEASGKNRKETVMLLNHKEAIQYLVEHLEDITISRSEALNIHALLADGLLVDPMMGGRLRHGPVGIAVSSYRPLDNPFVIEEEFDILLHKAATITDPFEQSFFVLVHIPYLQAFHDVNKRTSRIVANIPLLKAGLAPMSFLAMDDGAYVAGLLGVYELNNVSLLRDAYIDAYLASAENYKALQAELDSPPKATLVYRDFVRKAVRRCVLEHKNFPPDAIREMAAAAEIPEADREQILDYVDKEFHGLHEGNIVRYRLKPEDLARLGKR